MKIGFIGCGNMATAMIKGILDSGKVTAEQMIASAKSDQTREKISSELGIAAAKTNVEVVDFADVVFLAVKPQYYEEVISEIKDDIQKNQVIVTIAPGKTLTWLSERLGSEVKIIRTMPNTPAMVKEGMMGMCKNELVTDEELQQVKEICESFGKAEVVPESLIDVVVGVSVVRIVARCGMIFVNRRAVMLAIEIVFAVFDAVWPRGQHITVTGGGQVVDAERAENFLALIIESANLGAEFADDGGIIAIVNRILISGAWCFTRHGITPVVRLVGR